MRHSCSFLFFCTGRYHMDLRISGVLQHFSASRAPSPVPANPQSSLVPEATVRSSSPVPANPRSSPQLSALASVAESDSPTPSSSTPIPPVQAPASLAPESSSSSKHPKSTSSQHPASSSPNKPSSSHHPPASPSSPQHPPSSSSTTTVIESWPYIPPLVIDIVAPSDSTAELS